MRFMIKALGRKLKVDFSFKETDLIHAEDVRLNSKDSTVSKRVIRINRQIRFLSRYFGRRVFYASNLTEEEQDVLRRRGFRVTFRSRTIKGEEVVLTNEYIIKA